MQRWNGIAEESCGKKWKLNSLLKVCTALATPGGDDPANSHSPLWMKTDWIGGWRSETAMAMNIHAGSTYTTSALPVWIVLQSLSSL